MNKSVKIISGVLIFILLGIIMFAGGIWSERKKAVSLEMKIEAQYVSNKSNYDAMWKTIVEMTQVTDMQAEHFKDVYTSLITGRNQDANLLVKSIQEVNPRLETSLYTQIQNTVISNRKQFDKNQQYLTDIIREYNEYIVNHPIMSMITGRTKKDANEYITTSSQTKQAFETKEAEAINIRGDKKK